MQAAHAFARLRRVNPTWLRLLPGPQTPRASLVCFPHAGGAASSFRPWAAEGALREFDVFAVQYPGREDRVTEPMIADMATLADAIADAVRAEVDPPVVLLGHSMGASVAVEVTRRLEAAGSPPALLIVSGRRPPRHDRPPVIGIDERTDDDVIAEMAELAGTDPRELAHPELRELVLPIVRNDHRLLESYAPSENPIGTDVLVLWGREDPTLTGNVTDWRHVTTGAFQERAFGGGHFFLHAEPAATAAAVAAAIDAST